jgi:concanavalin A-like lectin/glucanase superfamily protein/VanZ like protein
VTSPSARGRQGIRRHGSRCILALGILIVGAGTLLPGEQGGQVQWSQIFCLLCGPASLADGLVNVALFLPLGVALSVVDYALRRAVVLSAWFSLSVELAQFAIPGREPSLQDFMCNVVGAALGGGLVRLASRWASPGVKIASRLSLVAAVATGAVFVLTDVLLRPSLPDTTYFGGSASVQPSDEPLRLGGNTEPGGYFQGRIDEVRVYGRARTPAEIQADMNTPITATAAPSDLRAAYNFDEGAGSRLADISGHGNAGRVVGATWTHQGKFGGALVFDGVRDLVVIPHSASLNLTSAMTLEAWIYPTAVQRGWRAILQKEFDAYFLLASSKAGALRPGGGGTFGLITEAMAAPATVPTGAWTHVALAYDGSLLSLYLDGRRVAYRRRWYAGRVIEAALDGLTIPAGTVAESRELRTRLLSGAPLRVRAVAPMAPVATQAPLVTLHDPLRNEILLVAADGDDVVFRLRTRAAAAALDSPALRARGALRHVAPGSEVTLTMSRVGRNYCLDVGTGSTCPLRFTLGQGWALLMYSQFPPGWPHVVFDGLWMAALLFPFGFWLRCRWESLLGVLVLIVGALLACVVGHLGSSPAEVGAAFAGIAAGWTSGRAAQYLRGPRKFAAPSDILVRP